ncbi:MAG: histidine phosphatase family protein [Phycisphaerales bacterium]|nr:histidine phosphatase family protein [Phycisphaerales bacterium]
MKTLLLMRHAKSEWTDQSMSDHDRPINERGRAAAPAMAAWMRDQDLEPEEVMCSSATRAHQTAQLVCEHLGIAINSVHRSLYLPSVDDMLGELVMAKGDRVLMVSHNPACEVFAERITGELKSMPTAAVAVIDFDIECWSDVVLSPHASLRMRQRPKAL